jgi:hypothetical protein
VNLSGEEMGYIEDEPKWTATKERKDILKRLKAAIESL